VILGTAQDGGLPHVACTCPRCEAARADPRRRRKVASLAIVLPASGRRYLVDATPDLREQLDLLPEVGTHPRGGVDRAPVDGIFLTHVHMGHILGLAFFGFEALDSRRLPVYATARVGSVLAGNLPWSRLLARDEIELRPLDPGAAIELGDGVRVTPFPVPHRDEDSDTVGFKIAGPLRTVVYVPDTAPWEGWPTPPARALEGCEVAVLDGTFYAADELPGRDIATIGHPLMTSTMALLGNEVGDGRLRVLFTHLNHSNRALDPEGDAARSIRARGFGIAAEGERIPL
jgi:pyrroloquinoline quinone biosynthesis protein B